MNGQDMAGALPVVLVGNPAERLTALFDVHYARLYRLARRLAPSTDDALDLVQETFLKAAQFPQSIPVGVTNEEAWLVRVLINIRRDQWRKRAVRDRHDKAAFRRNQRVSGGGDPEAVLIARTAVWQALDILPPRRRAIVVMYMAGIANPSSSLALA
jgi:RNA polymerase sigma factor (sigma-70 family)